MLRFLNSDFSKFIFGLIKPLLNERGHVVPEASTDALPAEPGLASGDVGDAGAGAGEVATPEPAKAPANDDPYKLYEGLDGDATISKVMEILRQPGKYTPKEVRAANDTYLNRTITARLDRQAKKFESRKYGDQDLEAKLAEAKAQWEKEHPRPEAPAEIDPERQAYLDSFTDPAQRADVEKMLELQDKKAAKTERALREELAKIKGPIDQAMTNAQKRARDERLEADIQKILEKVPHVDPFTINDVLEKNEALPEDQRMTTEEIIATVTQLEDERFTHLLPTRLKAKDAPTISLLKSTVMDAVKANEPWAREMLDDLLTSYEEAKRGAPTPERGGLPKPAAPATAKWEPHEVIKGR